MKKVLALALAIIDVVLLAVIVKPLLVKEPDVPTLPTVLESAPPTMTATTPPTKAPTTAPTEAPTEAPTTAPSEAPTEAPTTAPSEAPTEAPTTAPTEAPTEAPTTAPTEAPTEAPTTAPTEAPTEAPTTAPTEAPTTAPTEAPTTKPTEAPTEAPTQPAVSALSTEVKPSLSDFMWFFDGVRYTGVPSNAQVIKDRSQLTGGWKCFIWIDPDHQRDSYAVQFANAVITAEGDNVTMTTKLREIYFEGMEPISQEGEVYDYTGTWNGNGFDAKGPGVIHMTAFYTTGDGKQYAVGIVDAPDGTPTEIALVRP